VSDIVDDSDTFDDAKFRQVLGHFPTGVCVITAMADGKPVGMAVGSFTSLSLEPPQVLFCAGKQSSSYPKIADHGSFTVNLLAEDQEDVSRIFASKAADKFQELGWKRSGNGNPRLDGVLGYIDCTIADTVESGDHHIVVGAVSDLGILHEGGPLIFFRGGYGRYEV
jgi:3-hydroxy-9,10-secoandrosta-1,3,5(10)-triene-9,17-dione monooxygenase reductase component